MTTPATLPYLSSDLPATFYHFNDLAFDDDYELSLHLGM
jgi:hypothetical protein